MPPRERDGSDAAPPPMTLHAFQRIIDETYGARDAARGMTGTYMWFAEEVGELARAIRSGDPTNLREEIADVLAWLTTLATMNGVDLAEAASRYETGCPRCASIPCDCQRGPERS